MKTVLGSIILCIGLSSCVAVTEIERTALKDEQMQLSAKKTEKFETNFQTYREAASGANGGKVGGGCGCN